MWGSWGLNFLLVSKITGYVLGGLLVVISYLIGREVLGEKGRWYALLAAYLVGINQSVAYWSPAGLETAAFSVSVGLCLLWWLRRSWLLIWGMVLAVWFRPEGAVICGVLVMAEWIVEKRFPKFAVYSLLGALFLSLPLVGFKLGYYHGILPNPFYAKTSFHWDQFKNGLEYTWQFLQHYGLWGFGLIVPLVLLLLKRLTDAQMKLWWVMVGYVAYVTVIGGDVLKVHRFYVPMAGASAVLIVMAVWLLLQRFRERAHWVVLIIFAGISIPLTIILPGKIVKAYNDAEKGLVYNLGFLGRAIKDADKSDFSVAATTIGALGYELVGHTVIDMLGLTDSTIARHPRSDDQGITTTWKERQYNSRYLLSRAPEYIVFSTGIKPSAPAEKSLFLYKQFLDSYRILSWYTPDQRGRLTSQINNAYKKMHPVSGRIEQLYPIAYVEELKLGMEELSQAPTPELMNRFDAAIRMFPDTPSVNLLTLKAYVALQLGRYIEAEVIFSNVLASDSLVPDAHEGLFLIAFIRGNSAALDLHRRWLRKLEPWFVDAYEHLIRTYYNNKQ
jgi:hypothetical protein